MTTDPRAFFALDLGAATTAAALIGRLDGRWRLIGSAAFPAAIPLDGVLAHLVERSRSADPVLTDELGVDAGATEGLARLTARSARPAAIAVLAATERAGKPLVEAARRTGWRVRSANLDRSDALALTRLVLDPAVSTVLVGAGEPPGADERTALGELAALVAAAAARRPELGVVLAGALAEQLPRFEGRTGETASDVLLAPAATSGDPAGGGLRELLERLRAPDDDSRRAFVRATLSLAEALDRRVEAFDIGLDGALRAIAVPGIAGAPGTVTWTGLADAALVPPDPGDAIVDTVLGWSTVPIDRHRMSDRLRELRLGPWADAAGDGGPLRLAAARAALSRLVATTPELDSLPPPDLLLVSGGAWAVAPGPAIALAVADVVRRPGVSLLGFDHARLLAPLGTIEDPIERRAILADLADDLLVPLGSVVMPQGLRSGRSSGRLVVHGATGSTELDLVPGGLELVDLPPGETAVAEFQFRDAVRLGARGHHFAVDVAGGLGGLLVDLRDVPLRLPDRADRRQELLAAWQEALWAGIDA